MNIIKISENIMVLFKCNSGIYNIVLMTTLFETTKKIKNYME